MNTKILERYTIKPVKKKGFTFVDLAKKHIVKSKGKKTRASQQVDQIVYGTK